MTILNDYRAISGDAYLAGSVACTGQVIRPTGQLEMNCAAGGLYVRGGIR